MLCACHFSPLFTSLTSHITSLRYSLEGTRELLDAPTEWCFDSGAGLLYLWTPDGADPSTHKISARILDVALNVSDVTSMKIQKVSAVVLSRWPQLY